MAALKRSRRRRAVSLAAVAAVIYAFAAYCGLAPGAGWYWDSRLLREVTGCNALLGAAPMSYDSPRAFNGDGYSIAQYKLPKKVERCFADPKHDLAAYPKLPSYRKEWKAESWRRSEGKALSNNYVRWATLDYPGTEKIAQNARESLARPSTYYALRVKAQPRPNEPEYIECVDLFIVDPIAKRLFILNSNT